MSSGSSRTVPPNLSFLQGGGEMGERMRALDWSKTALGPAETWPQSLRSTVSMLLPSKAQIVLFWGSEYTSLYNDAYRPVFGAKHPSALGLPAREAWSEIWELVLHELLAGVVRTGEAFWGKDLLFELERNGFPEETYFDVSYDPVRVESGEVGGVYCIVTETTERVIGERRLALLKDLAQQNSAARTARDAVALAIDTLAERPHDIVFALAYLDDTLQSSTPGAERQLKAAKPELVKELSLAPAGMGIQAARLVVGLNPRRPFDDQYRAFVDLVADQLRTGLANAWAYEQERERAEALAELDRAKTAFFSNVSHEFRTPLTLLVGPLEDGLADSETPLPQVHRERQEVAQRNARRLLRLVNTLLEFSRIEAGRLDANYEPTDLARFTSELTGVFRSAVERAGLSFVVTCEPLAEPAYVDRDMWEKVVLNLLSNAFKFTFEGQITVDLRGAGDRITLRVSDTGVGIPEGDLPRMFERFHRVKHTRARTHEGTGIGLALVQELARFHGGGAEVISEEGRGTTFTVTIRSGTAHLPPERVSGTARQSSSSAGALPWVEEALGWLPDAERSRAPMNAPAVTVSDHSHDTAGVASVLIADDNADMRDYLARILGSHYHLDIVGDGRAAIDRLRSHVPDLVLADVMMPALDGFGLLGEIRLGEETRSLPVILLSARAGQEARIEGLEAGANEYLVKPFSARELLATVASQLQLSRQRRETERALRERSELTDTLNRTIQDASRLKDEFLASLSHELRTPLNAILGYSRMLRAGIITPERKDKAIETIERNATSLTQIVEDVLDISRIISGKIRLDVQPVELPDIVRRAVDAMTPAADAKGVRLETVLDPAASPISGDPERLQQVMWNLLSNGVKFTNRGGKVQVRLECVNSHIEVSVSDTGIGIAPEFLPHVFERFRQADAGISRERGGLGLGLSIARQLIEMHGGTIDVSSAGVNQGATFRVKLPVMILRPAEKEVRRVHPRSGTGARNLTLPGLPDILVLAVDDEPDALSLVSEVLQAAGARVRTASSAEEALRIVETELPDVMVADLGMPHVDGFQLIQRVRQHQNPRVRAVPAAALTAYARSEDRMKALAAGFQIHLAKPIDPAELVTTIASLARRLA